MLYTAHHTINDINNPNIEMSSINADNDGSLVFSLDNYDNEDEMYTEITAFIHILIKNKNTCKIYADSEGIIVVEFGHDEQIENWGCSRLTWLNEDEYEDIMQKRNELCDTLFNQDIE